MQGYKNYQDAQEETQIEETITLSLEEYRRMKEAVRSMERVKVEEKNGKVWLKARIYHNFIFCVNLECFLNWKIWDTPIT